MRPHSYEPVTGGPQRVVSRKVIPGRAGAEKPQDRVKDGAVGVT